MAKSSAALKGFGTTASSTSASTSKSIGGLSAAFLGVAVAVKAASDFTKFQATMVRTVTLAGATEEQMKTASAEILNVAVALGASPQDMAETLYQTESAGIAASHAMDVVTVSAKASAIGLGESATVADALTSVLNAYGEENISAARAADVLTAAVRDGKGEADAIAGAIGRVIPIASNMGVAFEEVAGGIAALTQTGLNASEAVTALRGILTGLLNPSTQAADALANVGLSADAVRNSITNRGLLPTLQLLQERFKGNVAQMGQVFGNVRALAGAMSLLGANSGDVAKVFDDVAHSGGSVDDAFKVVSETAEFKLHQALAAVEVALIDIGGAIAPVITGAAELVGGMADIIAGGGPLTSVLKTLAENIDLIVKALVAWFIAAKVIPGVLSLLSSAALATAIKVEGMEGAALAAASGLERVKLAAAGLSAILSVGLAVALIGIPELLDAASVHADTLADKLGLTAGGVQEVLTSLSAFSSFHGSNPLDSIFTLHPEGGFSQMILSLDGIKDQARDLLTGLNPAYQALQGLGLSALDAEGYVVRFASSVRDLSEGGIADATGAMNTNIATIQRLSAELKAGSTPVSSFIERMQQIGFTTREALLLAHLATGRQIAALKELDGQTAHATDITTAYGRTHSEVANIVVRGSHRMTEAQRAQAEAAREAAKEQAQFQDLLRSGAGLLEHLSSASGLDFTSIGQDFLGAAQAAKQAGTLTKDMPGIYAKALGETRILFQQWHDQIVENFGGAGSALEDFAGESNVSLSKATQSLKSYTSDIQSFGADIKTIQGRFGADAEAFVQWATDQGLAQQGLVSAVANGSKENAQTFIDSWKSADSATQKLATAIQSALKPVFDRLILWIKNVYRAFMDLPAIHPKVEAREAEAALKVLQDKLDGLAGRHEILVHTTFTSTGGGTGTGGGPGFDFAVHSGGQILHEGGAVQRFHSGSLASDEVPAVLQRGEFVLQRSAVQKIGVPALSAMNKMHTGGLAGGDTNLGQTSNVQVIAAAFETALKAVLKPVGGNNRDVEQARIRLGDIRNLLDLMGTSVKAFAKDIKAALHPEAFRDFAKAANQAIRSDDWQGFASAVRDAVGAKVFSQISEDARRAFDSGNIQAISKAVQDALRTDEWKAFAKTVREDATAALKAFHDQAVTSLDFTSGALTDLGSEAASAAAELAGGTDLTGKALRQLRADAKLTGLEILNALHRSAKETRAFAHDLLEVSKIGGQAGKDLAASLLASGNTAVAQSIADAPHQMQVDIVHAFGEAGKAADNLATKLTRSIAVSLKDIVKLLRAIARKWDIKVNLSTSGGAIATHHAGGPIMHDVARFHSGGLRSDEVPAILQKGEYVIRASAAARLGTPALDAINRLHAGGAADALRLLQPAQPMQPSVVAPKVNVNVRAAEPRPINVKVGVEGRRFGRDLDYVGIRDGYFQ